MTWSCSVGASLTEAAVETRCRACRRKFSDCASRADISVELTGPTWLFPPYLRSSKDISNAPDWNGIELKTKPLMQEGYSQLEQKVYSFPESTNIWYYYWKYHLCLFWSFIVDFVFLDESFYLELLITRPRSLLNQVFLNKYPFASLYHI